MAIAPLQLPSTGQITPDINWAPLANLGQIYQQGQAKRELQAALSGGANMSDPQSLSALALKVLPYDSSTGLSLASLANTASNTQYQHGRDTTNDDWREQEAARSQGNTNASLDLQRNADARATEELSLTKQKIKAAQDSANNLRAALGSIYGQPGVTAPAAAGAPVPSTPKVVGDAEGVATGLYDPPAAPGGRPPMQTASATLAGPAGPAPATAAAPASAAYVAPPTPAGTPGPQHIPVLMQALVDPNLAPGQRELATTLLKEAYKSASPPEKIQTLQVLQANPALLDIEKQLRFASKSEVNVIDKGESAFSKEGLGAIGKQFAKISDEGTSAREDIALIGQLRDLGAVVKTGAPRAIQGWLAKQGIKVGDNIGAVEAYGAIVDKMTPAQRAPGSGSSSDFDAGMFKNSLPKLINTPQGNEIISNTLASLAQYKVDRAVIAEKALIGELKPGDALKQMRDLPSPYTNFKEFAKAGGFRADQNDPGSTAPTSTGRQPTTAKEVPMTSVEVNQSLDNARAAVARNPGARDAIIQKLRGAGIDPSGL